MKAAISNKIEERMLKKSSNKQPKLLHKPVIMNFILNVSKISLFKRMLTRMKD